MSETALPVSSGAGSASLIYSVDRRGTTLQCDEQHVRLSTLRQFNVIAPQLHKPDIRAQLEPYTEYQTWGYDEETGLLILLFHNYSRISIALNYCDSTEFPTTIHRSSFTFLKEYIENRAVRVTTTPNDINQYDSDTEQTWNAGQRWIDAYLEKHFIWVGSFNAATMLHGSIADKDFNEIHAFRECVLLAIAEVEEQWSGKPKIDEVNVPVEELPQVVYPATILQRVFIYCMYGGYLSGWPFRSIAMILTAPLGHTWIFRGFAIWGIQFGYQHWKRFRIRQYETSLTIEETELLRDEGMLLLERRRLVDDSHILSESDLKKKQASFDAKRRLVLFDRKNLDLRRRNFYIQCSPYLSLKKRKALQHKASEQH